jgi:hypothetical protein
MAGHQVLIGQIQSQAMSHAKFVFLIALVVFFVVLFVAAYVWMRRPDFGQKGGRAMPTSGSGGTVAQAVAGVPSEPGPAAEPVATEARRAPEGPGD